MRFARIYAVITVDGINKNALIACEGSKLLIVLSTHKPHMAKKRCGHLARDSWGTVPRQQGLEFFYLNSLR